MEDTSIAPEAREQKRLELLARVDAMIAALEAPTSPAVEDLCVWHAPSAYVDVLTYSSPLPETPAEDMVVEEVVNVEVDVHETLVPVEMAPSSQQQVAETQQELPALDETLVEMQDVKAQASEAAVVMEELQAAISMAKEDVVALDDVKPAKSTLVPHVRQEEAAVAESVEDARVVMEEMASSNEALQRHLPHPQDRSLPMHEAEKEEATRVVTALNEEKEAVQAKLGELDTTLDNVLHAAAARHPQEPASATQERATLAQLASLVDEAHAMNGQLTTLAARCNAALDTLGDILHKIDQHQEQRKRAMKETVRMAIHMTMEAMEEEFRRRGTPTSPVPAPLASLAVAIPPLPLELGPDYAARYQGGKILRGLKHTSPYFPVNVGEPEYVRAPPEIAISESVDLGHCYPLPTHTTNATGSHATPALLSIQLSERVTIAAIAVHHFPGNLSLPLPGDENVNATAGSVAPREMVVYGLRDLIHPFLPDRMVRLGTFPYVLDAARPIQIFRVEQNEGYEEGGVYEGVRLEILSNHGHPNYTCIYRVSVHGAGRGPLQTARKWYDSQRYLPMPLSEVPGAALGKINEWKDQAKTLMPQQQQPKTQRVRGRPE